MHSLHQVFAASLILAGCTGGPCGDHPVVQVIAPADADTRVLAPGAGRTISVQGDAEILTAPDRFVVTVGFDVHSKSLDGARDEARSRAAALLRVAEDHGVAACDIQTEQLSLQPRYETHGSWGHQELVGYQANRSLTLTLHAVEDVEAVLYDMLAAGANRVDRVSFETSALQAKRAEARVLAVEAARAKAGAMAAALGQQVGEPLRVDEGAAATPWQPPVANYMLSNDTAAALSETVATGKIRVHAGVSVVFALRAG